VSEQTLGELVSRATGDLSCLMRKEVELAKLEITQDVVAAGKGAGLLGGAGGAGLLALVFLSTGAAFGIGEALGTWAGFLVVGVFYLLAAAVLGLRGEKNLSKVGPPAKTLETLKDDVAWATHPSVAPTKRAQEPVA